MKILAVYPYVPWPLNRGAYHRAYHLLKGLALDHQVDLLAAAEKGEGAQFRDPFQFCRRLEIIPFEHPQWPKLFPKRLLNPVPSTIAHWTTPVLARRITQAVLEEQYDAVHVLDLVLAQYFFKNRVPLVLDRTRVDLQYQWMEHGRTAFSLKARLLNYENFLKLLAFERAVARRSALQVVCGPDDESFIRRFISRSVPIEVIPNGVDLDYFCPEACATARDLEPTLIFCGAMDYTPNVDALRWYFSEMHAALVREIPRLKLLIVGKDPIPEVQGYARQPGVTVTGGVPDVRPYYKRAWLQIVPLRIGGGTRLKIVESLGIGTPVISTRIGAQGLDLRHEQDILYAETANEFIRETVRALQDEALRSRLQREGRQAAVARLSWAKLSRQLSHAYVERFQTCSNHPDSTRIQPAPTPRSDESQMVSAG